MRRRGRRVLREPGTVARRGARRLTARLVTVRREMSNASSPCATRCRTPHHRASQNVECLVTVRHKMSNASSPCVARCQTPRHRASQDVKRPLSSRVRRTLARRSAVRSILTRHARIVLLVVLFMLRTVLLWRSRRGLVAAHARPGRLSLVARAAAVRAKHTLLKVTTS